MLEAKQTRPTVFRNKNNVLLMQSMFLETSTNKSNVVYTLRDHEYQGFPSLYERYMAFEDVTEYLFATQNLDGWEHWKLLCESPFFQPYVARWREELELLIRARSLANIINTASDKTKDSFQASKYLAEKGWSKETKGRPSKAQVTRAARDMAENTQRLKSDLERIKTG